MPFLMNSASIVSGLIQGDNGKIGCQDREIHYKNGAAKPESSVWITVTKRTTLVCACWLSRG